MAKRQTRRVNVKVEGILDLVKMLSNFQKQAIAALDNTVSTAADLPLKDAERKAPVESGKLKKAIGKRPERQRSRLKRVYQVYVSGKKVKYGIMVEGKSPFLRPAFEKNRRKMKKLIKTRLMNALKG